MQDAFVFYSRTILCIPVSVCAFASDSDILVILETPLADTSVCVGHHTLAVALVSLPAALIAIARGPYEEAVTVAHAVEEFAVIVASVGVGKDALAVRKALLVDLALVAVSALVIDGLNLRCRSFLCGCFRCCLRGCICCRSGLP